MRVEKHHMSVCRGGALRLHCIRSDTCNASAVQLPRHAFSSAAFFSR